MFKVTTYPHGTFSWADCSSTDAANGKKFYADLMGWEFNDVPMGNDMFYTMFNSGGEAVAALSPMQPEMQQQGIPSFWTSYITVDDVDALVGKVKELGGTVMAEPFDVFEEGRMMIITDPTGANVALWQAKNHIGAGLVNTAGAMGWNELATPDSEKVRDFYGKLLGWEYQKMEGMDYHVIQNNGRSNGGILQMNEEWEGIPAHWMVYFSVADIDKAVEKVEKLGGEVKVPIVDADNIGRFSVIADPQGAHVSIIQLKEPDTWSA